MITSNGCSRVVRLQSNSNYTKQKIAFREKESFIAIDVRIQW